MKRKYEAPKLEVEKYVLDKNVAANCTKVVTFGPGIEGKYEMCEEYDFMGCSFPMNDDDFFAAEFSTKKSRIGYTEGGYSWYEEGCTMEECYYSPLTPMAS